MANQEKLTIALVDDENIVRISLAEELRDEGYKVVEFTGATGLLLNIDEINPTVIITDLKMPDINGLELLEKIKQHNPDISVILITAYASLKTAIQAMKLGAYDYLSKPFETEELVLMLERIREISEIKKDNIRLRQQLYAGYDFSAFIGDSEEIKNVFELVKIIAGTDTTVYVSGETGTGKELLTNIIHYNSPRKNKPLIKVSCALLAKELFESELFGHEKGAFTGAESLKKGRFELANNGTIYLDDIDDMPLDLQVKLLRVLEENEIERVGGTQTMKIDVRVIVSTKVNLKQLVDAGKFREDLYYRLHVFPIHIPPLRQHVKDIEVLTRYFVQKFGKEKQLTIEPEVIKKLEKHTFPGNTRELKNLCERLVLLAEDRIIKPKHIPLEITNPSPLRICSSVGDKPLPEMISEFEISAVKLALNESKFNLTRAADLLGIPLSTLRSKMIKYKIET